MEEDAGSTTFSALDAADAALLARQELDELLREAGFADAADDDGAGSFFDDGGASLDSGGYGAEGDAPVLVRPRVRAAAGLIEELAASASAASAASPRPLHRSSASSASEKPMSARTLRECGRGVCEK